jgi:hypothetical protein
MKTAAMATARPSIKYFKARFTNSPREKSIALILGLGKKSGCVKDSYRLYFLEIEAQ